MASALMFILGIILIIIQANELLVIPNVAIWLCFIMSILLSGD